MVKNSLKLEKINKEAEALVTTKAKKKQAKLKIIKSKTKIEKLLEQQLKKEKKKTPKKKKSGILGSLSTLEESLNQIKYNEEKVVNTKLSKREKKMLRNRDTERLEAVLGNRNFVANPLEAIRQHLEGQYK
ncbi:hypothetical protein SteCoe_3851 [Stentor coeruleus]|uniref:Ribosome biogenesis protein SLX9 n=1 Tax=Stentor coeruleus TaxID=5963 RepID=A0A1R2CW85_9CILI|nr:hypothetical protein SteCoe_3851 [Stentor coeruleus]